MTLFARFAVDVDNALNNLVAAGGVPANLERGNVAVEPPRDPAHGDISTNAAMVLAKPAGMNPRALAELLSVELAKIDGVTSVEIAGPGFINMRLDASVWLAELSEIAAAGADYGRSQRGMGKTVNVEYVSANPTGPMHMGHCRGAVVGDALANLFEFVGYSVIREYYVNDAGGQVDVLARSAYLRYKEALGEEIGDIPDGYYPGKYLKVVGQRLADSFGDFYRSAPEQEWLIPFRLIAVRAMMEIIKEDLERLGIVHDKFTFESQIQKDRLPEAAEDILRARGLVYDGVLDPPTGDIDPDWEPVSLPLFKSTLFGDDRDRPIKKSDGTWTYFGADIAYHLQKASSADMLVNIWGADHAGTVKRIKASVEALTGEKDKLEVKLVQMVRLMRFGEVIKMSKRGGNFVTIPEVVEEVTVHPVQQSVGLAEWQRLEPREAGQKIIDESILNINTAINNLENLNIEKTEINSLIDLLRKSVFGNEYLKNYFNEKSKIFDIISDQGKNIIRFTMLTRKADAQMDFDFAKVVEASKDNPVFYVQYAHARICSTLRKADTDEGFKPSPDHIALLGDEEIALIREAANFPRIVEAAAKSGEPHRIAFFLGDLAAAFHAYWNVGNDRPDKRFILAQSPELSAARLFLADNLGQVFRNGLRLMGVEAATQM